MQNKSVRELFAGSLWYETYLCTCYMRLSSLVQSHINTDSPVTLSSRETKRKYREAEERKDDSKRQITEYQGTFVQTLFYR
jgi:hypothetical protein